jgi:hypothetical protein
MRVSTRSRRRQNQRHDERGRVVRKERSSRPSPRHRPGTAPRRWHRSATVLVGPNRFGLLHAQFHGGKDGEGTHPTWLAVQIGVGPLIRLIGPVVVASTAPPGPEERRRLGDGQSGLTVARDRPRNRASKVAPLLGRAGSSDRSSPWRRPMAGPAADPLVASSKSEPPTGGLLRTPRRGTAGERCDRTAPGRSGSPRARSNGGVSHGRRRWPWGPLRSRCWGLPITTGSEGSGGSVL